MTIKKVKERHNRILNLIREKKQISFRELAELLGVHEMTIRRDIEFLTNEGLLLRIPKGVHNVPRELMRTTGDFENKQSEHENQRIAEYIVQKIIQENDKIFLGPGLINYLIAQELFLHGKDRFQKITIYTNVYEILAYEFAHYNIKFPVFFSGGELNPISSCFYGEDAIKTIKKWKVDKIFIESNAIALQFGQVLVNNNFESTVLPKIIPIAPDRILIGEPGIFERFALYPIAELSDFTRIITGKLKLEILSQLKQRNLEVREV
jgi:DeoR/GlpR family transcriptional regulator of sugar metabolism